VAPSAGIAGERAAEPVDDPETGTAKKVALTEEMASSYWKTGRAARAAAAFALERWQEARRGFAAYLKSDEAPPPGADRARVRLLMAEADTHLKAWKRAAKGFELAAEHLPLIADFIWLEAARSRFFAHDCDAALEHARKVAPDSIGGADAALLIGDMLRFRKQHAEVEKQYAEYLEERPKGIRLAEARFRLAEAQEALGKAVPDAIQSYRKITISDPTAKWAGQAQKRIDAILGGLPADERAKYTMLTADELIERGMAYYEAMRNPKSAADFEAALGAPGLTDESACVAAYHLANSWYKERNRTKSAPLFDDAIERCDKAGDVELEVKAAYQAGRSYERLDKNETSAKRFEKAEQVAAKNGHSYADDARLREAEAYEYLGDDAKVKELLTTLPDKYPDGDMRAEALWRVAWKEYRQGNYDDAVRWLKKEIEVKPLEDHYYAEGQAQYWLGRTYAKLGKTEQSIASYEEAVRKYPLTYYALLALNRLREAHPQRFAKLVAEITTDPPDYDPDQPAFHFKPRALYGEPGFARAIEFLRLGLQEQAEAELYRLGLRPPPGKEAVADPDLAEKLWAMAFLYDRAGLYSTSHWVTRWHIRDFERSWPVGHNRARWRIAYPKAYWSLLEEHAKKHGYPTALQIAIVREESAFDPLRESYANAIGLTQMIYPTAIRFAKGTGIVVSRETMRDPVSNVTVGAYFLGFLCTKSDKHFALVPPSYNAGEGATSRWLRERGDLPTDEWSETIPGDQARRYSKRVLASFFTYSFLEDGTIPEMPNVIPKSLIPEPKKKAKKAKGKKRKKHKKRKKVKRNY